MGIGWIDNIWNDLDTDIQFRSVDDRNNGALGGANGNHFTLDDRGYHPLKAHMYYHASWCGIPWYYNGEHTKRLATNPGVSEVQFYTSQMEGANWIVFEDAVTGDR